MLPKSPGTKSAGFCEKVAEQKAYEKPLPGEAAKKCSRRAVGTDCLFATTGLLKNDDRLTLGTYVWQKENKSMVF